MHRLPRLALMVSLALVTTPAASARTVVVPDDVTAIQAAIDLLPDTVLVRSGVYAERPVLRNDVLLRGVGETQPQLDAFDIIIPEEQSSIIVQGLHFKGLVRILTGDEVTEFIGFRQCRFDAGLFQDWSDIYDVMAMEISDCVISGPFAPFATEWFSFSFNFSDSPVRLRGDTFHYLDVRHNVIRATSPQAWGATGLLIDADVGRGVIHGNRIEGFPVGLYSEAVEVTQNVVLNCTDFGMIVNGDAVKIDQNLILRCGTGLVIRSESYDVTRNVIGRSTGRGVLAQADRLRFSNNTLFQNRGPGIEFYDTGGTPDVLLDHNIITGSGGYGAVNVPGSATLECNDWHGTLSAMCIRWASDPRTSRRIHRSAVSKRTASTCTRTRRCSQHRTAAWSELAVQDVTP